MQFFQHFNQPIPPPNTHWLDQHSANQEGDTSVSRLDRASSWHVRIRTIFICMRELQSDVLLAVHESWWSSWLFAHTSIPSLSFLSFYCVMPLTTLHQRQLAMLLLFSLALSSLSCFLSLDKLCLRFLRVPTPMHAHSLFLVALSSYPFSVRKLIVWA